VTLTKKWRAAATTLYSPISTTRSRDVHAPTTSAVSNDDWAYAYHGHSDDNRAIEDVLVGAYSRFVLVGADGVRLHEEVLYAAVGLQRTAASARLENLHPRGRNIGSSATSGTSVSDPVCRRVALTLAAYFRRSGPTRSTGAPKLDWNR